MPFVDTTVSRDIFRTIDLARELKKNAAIVGRPGVGKSSALAAYKNEAASVIFMTATGVSGNALRDLFREVSDALGIYTSGTIANVQRQMFAYNFGGHALIIDEAQNLKPQAFRELLHLSDFTGLCLIFCGNEEVFKRVNTTTGAFATINRRVPIRAEVNSISDEDTDRLSNAWGVEGMDTYKLLRPIGRAFHTDGVVSVLDIAARFADSKPIKSEHVRRACEPFPQYRSLLK